MPIADRSGRRHARRLCASIIMLGLGLPATAQRITALPDQTSTIHLSNHDINHVICQGGDIEDVKFSAEKAISVERGGSDAWIKFLVKEISSDGEPTRTYVTSPSEFFVTCNGAVYPLYAEPSDIAAQTVVLAPGPAQRGRANEALLGPLVEEERAVSITMALLQDRVPATFTEVAAATQQFTLPSLVSAQLHERRRVAIDGVGLSASEYLVHVDVDARLDERQFLVSRLGANIFAITLDRSDLRKGDTARLIVVRRGAAQ